MTDYEKGYLDGLHAAAIACEYHTGSRKSHMAERIRAVAAKMILSLELTQPKQ